MGSPLLRLLGRSGLVVGWLVVCGGTRPGPSLPDYRPATAEERGEFVFAVHPLHNPQRLLQVYGPVMDRLNRTVPGARFRFEASRDYADFEQKLAKRRIHFALPNPYQVLVSETHGYRVFGKMGDDHHFRGLLLVRRDSGLRRVRDLAGRRIGYPAPTALAATLLPQYFLTTHGLDVDRETRSLYVGSQESVILNVYYRITDAGATWPVPWIAFQRDHPEEARALVVQWETERLPNNGLVVRDDVPGDVADRVAEVLFTLHEDEEGRQILARIPLSRFEPATSATYLPVRRFMRRFTRTVRPMPGWDLP